MDDTAADTAAQASARAAGAGAAFRAARRVLACALWTAALLPLALGTALLGRARIRVRARLQRRWALGLLRASGVELDCPASPRGERALVVANHVSYVDIAVLAALLPCRFVAKSEIAGWPVFGPLARIVGTVFIRRGARRDVPRVAAEIERTLAAGASVAFFPEGEASSGASVRRFHSALLEVAATGKVPCLAVGLSYETPGSRAAPAETVCWADGTPLHRHLWRFLGLPKVVARVRWSGPFDPPAWAGGDRKQLALRLQSEVASLARPVRQA